VPVQGACKRRGRACCAWPGVRRHRCRQVERCARRPTTSRGTGLAPGGREQAAEGGAAGFGWHWPMDRTSRARRGPRRRPRSVLARARRRHRGRGGGGRTRTGRREQSPFRIKRRRDVPGRGWGLVVGGDERDGAPYRRGREEVGAPLSNLSGGADFARAGRPRKVIFCPVARKLG